MGQNPIDATKATAAHLRTAGSNARLGITVMIGVNDVQPEVFTIADARQVLSFAQGNTAVGRLSMWSVGRDNGGCAGQTFASPICSGLSQNNFDFARIFAAFR
jgi:hypothetical protein